MAERPRQANPMMTANPVMRMGWGGRLTEVRSLCGNVREDDVGIRRRRQAR